MSNHNFIQSRRNFLKGVTYTSALSVGGLSSVAYAMGGHASVKVKRATNAVESDIIVMQQQMLHKETVSLFNSSDEPIMLDALKPVTIERVNASLIVRPNVIDAATPAFTGMVMIHPRQRVSFDIQTTSSLFSSAEITDIRKLKGQHMHITSEHSAFNKLIPVTNPSIAETSAMMAAI